MWRERERNRERERSGIVRDGKRGSERDTVKYVLLVLVHVREGERETLRAIALTEISEIQF